MLKTTKIVAFKKAVITFLILFLITFAARTAYEVIFTGGDITVTYDIRDTSFYNAGRMEYSEKSINVASERVRQTDLDGRSVTFDQKYEKTANITTTSEQFMDDNKRLRQIIEQTNAVIQMENLRGLPGNRSLDMTIGVVPDNFDVFVELVQEIGQLRTFDVSKVDKTNEYRELRAQMETFQKSIESFNEMKSQGGDIQDLLLLESRILETREKIQDLGVSLGIYSTENSFCTINFSMREVDAPSVIEHTISVRFVLNCMKNAFLWTIVVYFFLFALTIGGLFGVWGLLAAYDGVKNQLLREPVNSEASDEEPRE
ncbi:MAG: DUF4349 domain-containing protein [Defluviitaleaceae bacterium]|nr:DUF4349 domain-containing protein [Defluviitaleaceae bacterium]